MVGKLKKIRADRLPGSAEVICRHQAVSLWIHGVSEMIRTSACLDETNVPKYVP